MGLWGALGVVRKPVGPPFAQEARKGWVTIDHGFGWQVCGGI